MLTNPSQYQLVIKFTLVSILLAFSDPLIAQEKHANTSLTFGFVPQQSAARLAKSWIPFLEYLSEQTGLQISFDTTPDIPAFEHALAAGKYDLAYMNPYHYVVYSKQPGYIAFGKAKGKKIRGILVVHKDSPIQSVQELAGKDIAFPSPFSFAASMLPRSYLATENIEVNPVYVKSHDSVYRNVASKRMIAGGGVIRTFNVIDSTIKENLRILWTSEGFTPHAFAAHPRVAKESVRAIVRAMTSLDTKESKALLKGLHLEGFDAASDSEWDDVRRLKLIDKETK